MLELKNIHINHLKMNLIGDLNLIVKENEIWTLKGPSGRGKTTLLKYILGIKEDAFYYNGNIYLDNIEKYRDMPSTIPNPHPSVSLHIGDCATYVDTLGEKSVSMIYLDPPFN